MYSNMIHYFQNHSSFGGCRVGMRRLTFTTKTPPLVYQSKLLCFSVAYLSSSLFLALYTSLSPATKCLFRSSPFDPLQAPLFLYPPSYGQHKYAVPTLRPSCDSPVFFSDYWKVFEEIQKITRNSTRFLGAKVLRYMSSDHGGAGGFGVDFSARKRVSYFDHRHGIDEIPCGFLKPFPIDDSDRIAMEKCDGVVVVSAIFGDHDKIRQPKGLGSRTLDDVCFVMFVDDTTLNQLRHHNLIPKRTKADKIGAWRIVKVSTENLYENPAMNGVIPKYLVHRLFPNSKYSIWVDAKMQLAVDPLLLIHSLVIAQDMDMAVSKHPFYVHTMEEAMATARWKKWRDVDALKTQIETYCDMGLRPWSTNKLPYPSDVPDSALILRKHGVASNLFSCLLFNELEAFNPRDQLAFAFVRDKMNPKLKLNMFEVEVLEQVVSEFRHNLKKLRTGPPNKRATPSLFVNGSYSKCDRYLLEMWGESQN